MSAEATTDKQADRLLHEWIKEVERDEKIGPAVSVDRLLDMHLADLRRTAVRNMERAGIPRTMARQVSGHLTESIYIRYAIGAENDALEVGKRMADYHRKERENRKIVAEIVDQPVAPNQPAATEGISKMKQ